MEDSDLIRQFLTGDEESFNILVRRHQDWVKGFILKSIGNRQDSEDLAQDVFVKIYFGLPNFRFESEFRTWAYRIVINRMNNYFRKQKLISMFSLEITETTQPEYHDEPEARTGDLMKMVKKLPRVQRNVMILRSFQDMSFKQVAAALSITENSAKVSYFKAKNNLKRMSHEG